MRREEYKRLGEYIAPYLEKNVGLKVTLSQGINNNKYFQTPRQVAVDSENDQIVRTGQFAYNKATTRNGEKISIAYREGPDCTVSSAYQVFYITDENKLNPHYLLMWFKRPEFDRYARFKSFGSAHEFFTWEEMCNVYLPIPSIDEQRKIVAEYQAVEQRIENNNRLIKALEDTAQAIYHHTFVENIDPDNLPEGWEIKALKDLATFKYGKLAEKKTYSIDTPYPIFSGYAITGYCDEYTIDKPTIVVIARGDSGTGKICLSPKKCFLSNLAISIDINDDRLKYYIYHFMLNADTMSLRSGSAQAQITIKDLEPFEIVLPPIQFCEKFSKFYKNIYRQIESIKTEKESLSSLLKLLLAKLS